MTMLSWAFTAAWWSTKLVWGTAGFVAHAVAWVLALPFRAVMLLYRTVAACFWLSLRLADTYWRVLVIEKAMLFSWVLYELVFSLSLLILLKATHALVWFFKRALWACQLFPEAQGWKKLLKSVSPGPDALCCICLEPFLGRTAQVMEQQPKHTADCCSMSQTSISGDCSSHLHDTSTDDCCTSQPSMPSTPQSYTTRSTSRTNSNENNAQSPASHPSASHSMQPSHSTGQQSTGSIPDAQHSFSSLTHPFSASFNSSSLEEASSSFAYPSSLYSDDSSSQQQSFSSRPWRPAVLLCWLPAPCQTLVLRLLAVLRSSSPCQHAAMDDDTCPGSHVAPSSACELPCGHTFCRPCVTRWLERHQQTCPLCRRSLHPPKSDSQLAQWLEHAPAGQRLASTMQPVARVARGVWALLMALVLCGPFMYGWYYTVQLAGARVGVYHHLLSQSAWADFVLCLVLFVRVLHRRCALDPTAAAT